jgi:hypothetical protein
MGASSTLRPRLVLRWAVIGGFAFAALFLGSCPDGAMAGQVATTGEWFYQCPIIRPFVPVS